jgi:hypothetical protein
LACCRAQLGGARVIDRADVRGEFQQQIERASQVCQGVGLPDDGNPSAP